MSKCLQRTIGRPVSLSGVGIHTGEHADISFSPAEPGQGIVFIRTDLPGKPSVPADIDYVVEVARGTTLERGQARVQTVEHLLAAACGLGIDNLTVEINRCELPVGDGSANVYANALLEAGLCEQDCEREFFTPTEAVYFCQNGTEIAVVPAEKFSISATIHYNDRILGSQFMNIEINRDTFLSQISPARTYCFESEIKKLNSMGLGMGGSLDNTIIVGDEKITNTKLRFHNEFVRHKILDLMGDLYLLGMPLKAAVIANRSGHAANVELTRKLREDHRRNPFRPLPGSVTIELPELMNILPHRYPFLLVDRVIMESSKKVAYGFKNVTVDEPVFKGHFPEDPVFPRTLMMEFMAQSSAVMLLSGPQFKDKLAYFIVIEKAEFFGDARPPGLLRSKVELTRARERGGRVKGYCYADCGKIAEAEFMFSIVDR